MAKKVWTKKSTVPSRVKAARMRKCPNFITIKKKRKKQYCWWQ